MAITPGTLAFRNTSPGFSLVYSHTVTVGADLALIVGVMDFSTQASGVTYAGVSMANVLGTFVSLWSLVAPATGANNVVVTFTAYGQSWTTTSDWAGVDQTSPIASSVADSTSGSTAVSSSVTCPSGSYILTAGTHGYTGSGSYSANAGTTLIGSQRWGGSGNGGFSSYRTSTGSTSVNLPGSAGSIGLSSIALQPSSVPSADNQLAWIFA